MKKKIPSENSKNANMLDDDFSLESQIAPVSEPAPKKKASKKKAAGKKKEQSSEILSYRYDNKRKNNPPVGMVDVAADSDEEKNTWAYDPHIDPALQFDSGRAEVENLIDDALASGDQDTMRAALEQLKRMQEPYLNWAGKAEGTSFDVDTVSVHVHERIDPATILAGLQKRLKDSKGNDTHKFQSDLFHAPFENLPLREAVDFYKHDKDWSNRLIAGDSLLVMNSLLKKEGMAGQVQMFYFDPPYGIKYGSNFQPFTNNRAVKDRSDSDLTQEPEMIKAFRDTWELGIHSYLTYLRDRLSLAKELLNETGSVFVQISDENVHHVRELMDEIFGIDNFMTQINYKTMMPLESGKLESVYDYLVWYAKDKSTVKYHNLYEKKSSGAGSEFVFTDEDGLLRKITSDEKLNPESEHLNLLKRSNLSSSGYTESCTFDFDFSGENFTPVNGKSWRTTEVGIERLKKADRLFKLGQKCYYKLYMKDFGLNSMINSWHDTIAFDTKNYVVQTTQTVVERCLLMTTDTGDLVLDPTCGSGTSAFVSEKHGRRWITCDTSRVAITLAKQRLMTAGFDYYELKYPHEGLKGGFIYKTQPHITLKAISNNPEVDTIYDNDHPLMLSLLGEINQSLKGSDIRFKVEVGARKGLFIDFKGEEVEGFTMPDGRATTLNEFLEWEVPFIFPDDWPEKTRNLFDAYHDARKLMQKKMDASIESHAGQEVLYDQPSVSKNKLRITGPFTVEAVPFATVLGLDEAEQPKEANVAVARSGASSRHNQWRDELLKAGIRGKGGQQIQLLDLSTVPGTKYLHAQGTTKDEGETIAVSFGPEHAALEQRQVEIAITEARNLVPKPSIIVFCAFTFDPEAAKDIDETNWPGVTLLKAQMNTDLLTKDLKKGRASNESFWLMGQPDIEVRKNKDGLYEVEVNGFDYFDTKSGELKSGGKKNIAMWSLDTDYDNRSLFPQQVFFPMAGAKDGWNKLKKDIKAELDETLMAQYHSTVSLPFEKGDNECIAVKIVDDRGIESLKVINLD